MGRNALDQLLKDAEVGNFMTRGLWVGVLKELDQDKDGVISKKGSGVFYIPPLYGSYRIYGSSKGSILSKPPLPFRERIRGEGDRRTDWHHALRRMCRASLASAPQYFLC